MHFEKVTAAMCAAHSRSSVLKGWAEQHIDCAGKEWISHHSAVFDYDSVCITVHRPITATLGLQLD